MRIITLDVMKSRKGLTFFFCWEPTREKKKFFFSSSSLYIRPHRISPDSFMVEDDPYSMVGLCRVEEFSSSFFFFYICEAPNYGAHRYGLPILVGKVPSAPAQLRSVDAG